MRSRTYFLKKRTNLLFNKDWACNQGGPSNKTQGFHLKDRIISSIKTYSLVIVTIVIILDIHLGIVELTSKMIQQEIKV